LPEARVIRLISHALELYRALQVFVDHLHGRTRPPKITRNFPGTQATTCAAGREEDVGGRSGTCRYPIGLLSPWETR
jgi:hypothetical protein